MNWKEKYYLDIGIAVLIVVLPLLQYLHILIPRDIIMYKIFNITFNSGRFINLRATVYYFLNETSLFFLLCIWYVVEEKFYQFTLFPMCIFVRGMILSVPFVYIDGDYVVLMLTALFLIILVGILTLLKRKWKISSVSFNSSSYKKMIHQMFVILLNRKKSYHNYTYVYQRVITKASKDILKLKSLYTIKLNTKKDLNVSRNYGKWTIPLLFFLVFSPLIFQIYRLIPTTSNIKWFFMYEVNNGFPNGSVFIYLVIKKTTIILLFIVWYTLSNNWFKICVLCPITIYSYQLYEVLFGTSSAIDELEYIKSLPVILVILGITQLCSLIYKYDLKHDSLRVKIDQEIDRLINKFAKRNSEL